MENNINNNSNEKIQDVSQEEQIIPKGEADLELPKMKQPIYIRTLNVFTGPVRRRYERHYKESKKHLVADVIFVIIILLLILANILLFSKSFPIENIQININKPAVDGETDQQSVEIKNTDLILNPQIVYYTSEGEQLGIGPWPPVVGEVTLIRIILNISSSIHNVSNLKFSAKLPANIIWTDKTAVDLGQAFEYDEANNLITWKADNLSVKDKFQGSFELEFTPDENNLGKKIKLLENLSVVGFDLITAKSVTNYANDLYTPEVK